MEQLQVSYVSAVAAAAGCAIVGEPKPDDGIDFLLSHRSKSHQGSGAVYLELQLKATSQRVGAKTKVISAQMRADRYAEHVASDPNVNRIVVVMSMPDEPGSWISASHDQLALRHCAYWVNLAGTTASSAVTPTVSASIDQIFDDVALCGIMQRIGQRGRP